MRFLVDKRYARLKRIKKKLESSVAKEMRNGIVAEEEEKKVESA
jgi:hypothetical protein